MPGSSTDRAFGDFLVESRVLRSESLRQAMASQSALGGRLDTVLLDLDFVSETALLDALGDFFATRTASSSDLTALPPEVARLVSPRLVERFEVVPFRLDGRTLSVATRDPGDPLLEDEISLLTELDVASFIALEIRVHEAMARVYGVPLSVRSASVLRRLGADIDRLDITTTAPVRERRTRPAKETISRAAERAPSATEEGPSRRRPDALALEISTEELSLFPSLRESLEEGGTAEPSLHGRKDHDTAPVEPHNALEVASTALVNAEMREDIADAVLGYCRPILRRRLLLAVRRELVVGWRGEGEGVVDGRIRTIEVPLSDPSVFAGLSQGTPFWLGPLPRMARNQELVRALGGRPPPECIILPLIVRGKTVCFLYGDNVDQPVSGLPISELRRLVAKASLAFQVSILKSKIRNL
jgi:hypothetical protein